MKQNQSICDFLNEIKEIGTISSQVINDNCFEHSDLTVVEGLELIKYKINEIIENINNGNFKGDKGDTGDKGDKGDKGEPGDPKILINDNDALLNKTYSSKKICDMLNNLNNVFDIISCYGSKIIENSRNGLLFDFKIEGKTLVNLIPNTKVLNGNGLNFTISVRFSELPNLKPNTKYYIKIFDPENKVQRFWAYSLSTSGAIVGTEGVFTSVSDLTQATSYLHVYPNEKFTQEDIDKIKVVMVEGEKQEINTYFEGEKSVGDAVDEIVISSVKGDSNLIDFNELEINKSLNPQGELTSDAGRVATGYIRVEENTKYYFKGTNYYTDAPTRSYYCFYDINKKLIGDRDFFDNYIFTTPQGCAYVRLFTHSSSPEIGTTLPSLENVTYELYKGTSPRENIHKSDKKKVLYYDTELQSWKKPILSEGDSIKKHSDGKYYYYNKNGKVYKCNDIFLKSFSSETLFYINTLINGKITFKSSSNHGTLISELIEIVGG